MLIGVLGLAAPIAALGRGDEGGPPSGTHYYSTAEAPSDYVGPAPTLLALVDLAPSNPVEESLTAPVKEPGPKPDPDPAAEAPRMASTAGNAAPALKTAEPGRATNPTPSPRRAPRPSTRSSRPRR